MDSTRDKVVPVLTILGGLVIVWYVFAVWTTMPVERLRPRINDAKQGEKGDGFSSIKIIIK